jgi:vibriolysin
LGSVHQYFDTTFDWDGLDGLGGTIHAAVHMNIANNALWDEATLTLAFGDGDTTIDPTWSDYDFVSHEYMHGVTQYKGQNNLGSDDQAQAIDEGLSDIFAAAFDAYRKGGTPDADTWLWAEAIWSPAEEGDAIRYLHRPKLDLDQPNVGDVSLDCYPEYEAAPETEAHRASGILNVAFYLLSQGGYHPSTTIPGQPDCSTTQVTGIGIAAAAKVFLGLQDSVWA